jgi:diaminohydroxyphosphoribosylaminopyrimidine deaminase/5-amino-6-(5-phosphoribosylamino)uracil reductase
MRDLKVPVNSITEDIGHMRHALRLAARGLGQSAPNPAVGCVIVSRDGLVVGRGWTQPGGRPHAEAVALLQAGALAHGGTAYVTLEPCAHHGQTPPCADALIAAGITRVVGAAVDPDPRVNGQGFGRLEGAGVSITRGVCEAEARTLNAGFFHAQLCRKPLVALKIAESADGFVADASGNSRWITSETARQHGHLLRSRHEAILTGIGTVLADDPLLTCRLPGLEHRSPVRAVLDTRLRLSPSSQLARTARQHRLIVFTAADGGGDELAALGVEIVRVPKDAHGRVELAGVLEHLAPMTRVLVEGGPTLNAALLNEGVADIVHLYRAPILLGAGSRSALGSLNRGELGAAPKLRLFAREQLGPDVLESYEVTR